MATQWMQQQIVRLLEAAGESLAQGDWASVRQRAQDILALEPENEDGTALLAAAQRAVGTAATPVEAPAPSRTRQNSTDQPSSFANGRYEVKRFLGEGGKKKVYLAQDTLLDREVAFALIKTEGLDEISRTRITREAQAMGRLPCL